MKHAERCSKRRVFAPELCFRPDGFHFAWPQNAAITLKRVTGIHNLSSTHAPCAIVGWCVWVSALKITLSRACVKNQFNMFTELSQSCYWLQSTFPAESQERYQLAVCEITSVVHEEVACEYPTTVGFNRQLTFFNEPFSIRHQRSRHQTSTCSCRVTLACLPKLELISQAWLCVFVSRQHITSQLLFSMWRWAALLFYSSHSGSGSKALTGLWCFQLMFDREAVE